MVWSLCVQCNVGVGLFSEVGGCIGEVRFIPQEQTWSGELSGTALGWKRTYLSCQRLVSTETALSARRTALNAIIAPTKYAAMKHACPNSQMFLPVAIGE